MTERASARGSGPATPWAWPLIALAVVAGMTPAPAQNLPPPAIETTPWRDSDDTIEGWDWSLPPGVWPVAYSGVKYYDRDGRAVPGNRIGQVAGSWRECEPQEGAYDFEPLRKRLQELPEQYAGAELHVYASVYETRYTNAGKVTPGTGPLWLIEQYGVPLIEEKEKTNLATPFQVVNFDIFNPTYHSRYLKFVEELRKSGIAQMPQVMICYLHGKSSSRGEEAGGTYEGPELVCMEQRMDAWARAFGDMAYKLAWVGNSGEVLDYAYSLGMGQRNGFVEMYLGHCNNPQLGQSLDEHGYLVVEESCPPIAEGRAFGDENEEYAVNVHVPRFGPVESWPHRYRESMLRVLQMRRNFVWAEGNPWVDPPLLAYVSLELGRTVNDAPDAWCYLRESYTRGQSRTEPQSVKNFERWLYQRDGEGCGTVPTERVEHPIPNLTWGVPEDYHCDYIARRTDLASGNDHIAIAVDDRFLSGGPHRVAVKVTYLDTGNGRWRLGYHTPEAEATREVACEDTGRTLTATILLDDACFPAHDPEPDIAITAIGEDATVSFVRVVKLGEA